MISKFFIERPRFAIVISIVITIAALTGGEIMPQGSLRVHTEAGFVIVTPWGLARLAGFALKSEVEPKGMDV